MPDILDENGLILSTRQELVEDTSDDLKATYGQDINLDQNSPDGQFVNIFAQAGADVREFAYFIYNSFSPLYASGNDLDQRVALNGIKRKGGTYTIVSITIVVDRTLSLKGLDEKANAIDGTGYTVQDNAGNQFILLASTTLTQQGVHSLDFRAKEIGEVNTIVNTITTPSEIVLGVVSVNNQSAPTQVGKNQESNVDLRARRERSFALAALGAIGAMEASLLALQGVTEVRVYENDQKFTNTDGIPPHSSWVIVDGGAPNDIAEILDRKKTVGAGWKGQQVVNIEKSNNILTQIKFDRPVAKDLYLKFDIKPVNNALIDLDALKAYIIDNLVYKIGSPAESSGLVNLILGGINETAGVGAGFLLNLLVSKDDVNYTEYLEVDTKDEQYTLDITRITITLI